jgi:proteasome accessory factor C
MPCVPEAPAHRKPARASERLGRLLAIVPYLVEHPGTELKEAASLFGMDREALAEDLGVLFMSGLPPYGPGDLIDVEMDEDRVWIRMADYFSRPLRLTRNEALTLYLRGTALAGAPALPEAPALTSALAKLRDSLGPETLGEAARVEAAEAGRPAQLLDLVRRAAAGRERLEIEYLDSAGDATTRRIDAEEVFSALGNWYVVAWDHRSDEERMFRADRIHAAAPTGDRFEPRGLAGAGRPLYTPTEADVSVRLALGPEARWIAEYHVIEERRERRDGRLEVTMLARELEWAARLVLRVAPHAEVLDPPALARRVVQLASETLAGYGIPTTSSGPASGRGGTGGPPQEPATS